jgi:hypothetical protein
MLSQAFIMFNERQLNSGQFYHYLRNEISKSRAVKDNCITAAVGEFRVTSNAIPGSTVGPKSFRRLLTSIGRCVHEIEKRWSIAGIVNLQLQLHGQLEKASER